MNEARVLGIRLGALLAGYLTHYRDGKNVFLFDDEYVGLGPERPILSLSFTVPGNEQATERKLRQTFRTSIRLPPYFSNLLPEGALREYLVRRMQVHTDHEFEMLDALGDNLPGAVIAETAREVPEKAVRARPRARIAKAASNPLPFSLGGAQLKFSMMERGGRFSLMDGKDEWIVKPPHPVFPHVPANEFAMMKFAEAAGVTIPEVRLVPIEDLDLGELSALGVPRGEPWAFAIKRFDRTAAGRVHAEDFAQVFDVYGEREYDATNYDSIGRLVFKVFADPFGQIEQFVRRLVVNILVGNSDAHLKNWSILYADGRTPKLSPAYDIVSTIQYTKTNTNVALNLGKEKKFHAIGLEHFDRLARRIGVPAAFVLDAIESTVSKAGGALELVSSLDGVSADLGDSVRRHWNKLDPALRPPH